MSTAYHTITIEYGDDMLEVELIADVEMVNDGIGPYEFWGYKGYDRRMVPEVGAITYNHAEYTQAEREAIDRYIDEHEEQIITEICEKYEEDE